MNEIHRITSFWFCGPANHKIVKLDSYLKLIDLQRIRAVAISFDQERSARGQKEESQSVHLVAAIDPERTSHHDEWMPTIERANLVSPFDLRKYRPHELAIWQISKGSCYGLGVSGVPLPPLGERLQS